MVNYTRTCLTASSCPCPGNSSMIGPCNTAPCGYPRVSCCGNMKATAVGSEILCVTPGQEVPAPPATCNCCPPLGIWSSWTDAQCNDTCGGYGNGTRIRTCLSEAIGCPCTGENNKTGACNLTPCGVPRKACADGRSVTSVGSGFQCLASSDTVTVNTTTCCPAEGLWESWSAWSTCNTTCGACSNATRRRTCASEKYGCPCTGSETVQSLPCNIKVCSSSPQCCTGSSTTLTSGDTVCGLSSSSSGQWSSWADTACSDTCGLCGIMQQTRTCSSGTCTGPSVQNTTTKCAEKPCAVGNGRASCCSPAKITVSGAKIICG